MLSPTHENLLLSEVEFAVLDTVHKVGPPMAIEREWSTATVLAIPYGDSAIGQGSHLHTRRLAAPAARAEQQRGVVLNYHLFLPVVVLIAFLQDVCDELGGLISSQTLTYQNVKEFFVDAHIRLLLKIKLTDMALDVYKILIVGVSER